MPDSTPGDAESAAQLPAWRRSSRTVPCPFCGAAVGSPCRTGAGRATYEHGARSSITRRAQNIGYEEGLRDALLLLDWKSTEGVEVIRDQVATQLDMVRRHNVREEAQDA